MSSSPPETVWATREKLVHYWVGENWLDPFYDPFTQILCVVQTKTERFWNPETDSVVNSDKKSEVTCQECLEWLHA